MLGDERELSLGDKVRLLIGCVAEFVLDHLQQFIAGEQSGTSWETLLYSHQINI